MENVFEHDAIPTWSGFIYQGRIAAYLAIKKIIELRDDDKVSEVDKYAIEMEKCEDIAIVYKGENEKREYISIHQVKNEKEDALSEYKIPLIQTRMWRLSLEFTVSGLYKVLKILNLLIKQQS